MYRLDNILELGVIVGQSCSSRSSSSSSGGHPSGSSSIFFSLFYYISLITQLVILLLWLCQVYGVTIIKGTSVLFADNTMLQGLQYYARKFMFWLELNSCMYVLTFFCRVLFDGENDFCICLKETFPQLKVKKMTRVEWCKVRRLMGKPRR